MKIKVSKLQLRLWVLLRIDWIALDEIYRRLWMNLASSIQLIAIMCPHFPGFIVNEDFVVVVEDHKTKAMKKSKESLHGCDMDLKLPAIQAVEKLAACLHKKINATISDQQQEIDFQANLRKDMGEKLALYACQDDSLSTSQSIANKSWTYINNDVTPPKASELSR